jgi:hypothetical protein
VAVGDTYRFSFTACSSLIADFTRLAKMVVDAGYELDKISRDDVGKEKERTNQRQFQELRIRLSTLTNEEIEVLADGDLNDKKCITLLALCKSYRFVLDFVVEVVREKALIYDFEIRESDYNTFVNRKIYDHPELEQLSETTKNKIKQVLFRIFAEVGLIDNARSRVIQHILIAPRVNNIVSSDNPELLKIFLKPDREIKEATNAN